MFHLLLCVLVWHTAEAFARPLAADRGAPRVAVLVGSRRAAARAPRPLCSGISDLPEDCDVKQVVEAVKAIGTPSGSVEEQQAAVISYLIKRLQLEDDLAEREREWMYTIQVAGDLGLAGELLQEKDALQEKLDEFSEREAQVDEAVRSRDELSAQVEAGRQRATEAEEELMKLTEACAKLEMQLAVHEAEKERIETARAECKESLRTIPETISALKTKINFLSDEADSLATKLVLRQKEAKEAEDEVAKLEPKAKSLEAELAQATVALETARQAAGQLRFRVDSLNEINATSRAALTEAETEEAELREAEAKAAADAVALPKRLAQTQRLVDKWKDRLVKLNSSTVPLLDELTDSSAALEMERRAYRKMGLRWRACKDRLERTRRERARLSTDAEIMRERIAAADAAAKAVTEEVAVLKAEAPSLLSTLEASEKRIEEALMDAEAFSAGPSGAMLNVSLTSLPGVSGATMDKRVAEQARLLQLSAEQADGWGSALGVFHSAVEVSIEAATNQSASAQQALETLVAEQRRATAAARETLEATAAAMAEMEEETNRIFAANLKRLQSLQAEAQLAASRNKDEQRLVSQASQGFSSRAEALVKEAAARATLAGEEQRLRLRWVELQKRRQEAAAIKNRESLQPIKLIDLEAGLGKAAKAAEGLFSLFGKSTPTSIIKGTSSVSEQSSFAEQSSKPPDSSRVKGDGAAEAVATLGADDESQR